MKRLLAMSVVLALLAVACQQPAQNPALDGSALKEGDRAPDFTLESPEAAISLDDYRGEKPVLLYFSMGPG